VVREREEERNDLGFLGEGRPSGSFDPPRSVHSQRNERRIEVANGVQADAEAVGDVFLVVLDGSMLVLRDVLYVPSLHRNLISISRMNKDGYDCHFGNGKVRFGLIMHVLDVLSFTMRFIYYHYVKK